MADVLCEQHDSVALVTLNRPARRNALSAALISSLRATLAELDAQPGISAVVLTGADPAFCAGLDLTELGLPGSQLASAGSGPVLPPLTTPLIGAVNGAAVTGGLELALACDFLIASDRAAFADTHAVIEERARARWHTAGIDRAEVARRRDAVIERGRSQAGPG